MKKMMYLLFVFSLLPVAVVSADDFIDNRLQVNNSRLETEEEKTLGGQLDATESLFNEKDQKKLADEKRKQEKQLTDSDGQLFSAIKGKKKTEPEADLFQPENQKLSKFESNVEDNSASLADFIPALQMLAWSALLFGIALKTRDDGDPKSINCVNPGYPLLNA